MKNSTHILFPFLFIFLLGWSDLSAQCNFLGTPVAGPTLTTVSGTANRSGVAWNPIDSLYYSVNAGSGTYPIETFSAAGGSSVASVAAGISFRGIWWNPANDSLEGNGHGTTGLRQQYLDANGYALGTGTAVYTGQNQPNSQSCGDLDYHSNEVIYYDNGSIYRYARSNGATLGNYALNNNPGNLTDITDYGVIYTGCTGNEIGIYDYTNRRVYLFDKATGNWSTTVQLPGTAPQPPSFGISWANDMIWIFDGTTRIWHSFRFIETCTPPTAIATPVSTPFFCDGDSVQMIADTGSGWTYQWQLNGVDIPGATGPSWFADTTGAYTVIVNDNGCADTSFAINSTAHPLPNATVSPTGPTTFCDGDSVDLIGGGGVGFQWMESGTPIPGAIGTGYSATTSGMYSVMVTDTAGCSATSSDVTVMVNPLPTPSITASNDSLLTDQGYAAYQWYMNGNAVGGATDYFYVPGATGIYDVIVTDSNGCDGQSDTLTFVFVGIAEQLPGSYQLFPNPVRAQLQLTVANDVLGKGEIKVLNLLGAEFMVQPFEKQRYEMQQVVDLGHLAAGMYVLEIRMQGQRWVKRFVKE